LRLIVITVIPRHLDRPLANRRAWHLNRWGQWRFHRWLTPQSRI